MTKPCKKCGAPAPAIPLQGENRTVWVADDCEDCRAAIEAKATPAPSEPFELEEGEVTRRRKICEGCQQEFWAVVAVVLGRTIDTVRFCQTCSDNARTAGASAKQAAFIKARELDFMRVCPEFYRGEEITKALPKDKLDAVAAAFKLGKGIQIYGESGKFKTTAMFHGAIKRAVWQRKTVQYVVASEWKPACSHAAKETTVLPFLRPFISADVLFLDDLGNMAGTPASEEALHLLFEKRMQQNKPMFVTTQYTGAALAARFKKSDSGEVSELAHAIIRRLGLLTGHPIKFK